MWSLDERTARLIFKQVAKGTRHLHRCGFVHRDIKLENILLDGPKPRAMLGDFGYGTVWSTKEVTNTPCGSIYFASPGTLPYPTLPSPPLPEILQHIAHVPFVPVTHHGTRDHARRGLHRTRNRHMVAWSRVVCNHHRQPPLHGGIGRDHRQANSQGQVSLFPGLVS